MSAFPPRGAALIRALLSLAACAGLTACGGSSSTTPARSAAAASASRPAAPAPSTTAPAQSIHVAGAHAKAPARSRSSSAPAATALRHAFASFATCLSAHGVKLPPGTGTASALTLKGVDTKTVTYRRAQSACIPAVTAALKAATGKHPSPRSPTPGAPAKPGSPLASIKVPASATAILDRFTACMRSHGIPTFPEPTGASFDLAHTNIDSHSPGYKAAETACNQILRALDPPG